MIACFKTVQTDCNSTNHMPNVSIDVVLLAKKTMIIYYIDKMKH